MKTTYTVLLHNGIVGEIERNSPQGCEIMDLFNRAVVVCVAGTRCVAIGILEEILEYPDMVLVA